jgi:hypothetical protein
MTISDWVRGGPAGRVRAADWMRGGAAAIAAARTAIGVVALAAPTLVTRPWLGPDRGPAARVLGRALGGRDLALGLGALAALQPTPAGPQSAGHPGIWIGLAALSDAMDVLATVAAWDELPPVGRWLVAMSAGGSAVAGAAAAGSLLTGAAGSLPTGAAGSLSTGAAGSQLARAAADGA